MILGIDLGTTNSLIALWQNGRARVFAIDGSNLIPSVVAFDETGEVLAVGARARALKQLDPRHVVFSVKRLMGKGMKDLNDERGAYDFSESTPESLRLRFGRRTYTPEEVSALILRKCVQAAEQELQEPIKDVVITVPAYFNEAERAATGLAGRLAGLEVKRIINEPTAAALAYGLRRSDQEQVIAVYDFGGGTFDISILKLTGEIFEVLSTHGDTKLGGDDLDRALLEWIRPQTKTAPKTKEEEVLLLSQCEELKKALTTSERVQARIQYGGQVQWEGLVTRREVDLLWEPILARTFDSCREALRDAKLSPSDIDRVLLVGGSTRVPLCRERVQEFFGKAGDASLNPDEVVALGAAIQGEILSEHVGGSLAETLLLDVVPLSLGLETMGGLVSKIIHRNSTIPCSASEYFTTSVDGQTSVSLHVLQGEREFVKDCRSLGHFQLKIPPMPAGIPKLQVTFTMDANGMLRVRAFDERTGAEAQLEVKPSYGLSDEEIERMLEAAFSHAERDVKDRMKVEATQSAQSLIRLVEKSLQNPMLPAEFLKQEQEKLAPILAALRADVEYADSSVIHTRTKELELASHQLAEKIVTLSLRAHVSV